MASSKFVRVPTGLVHRDLIGVVEILDKENEARPGFWRVIIYSAEADRAVLAQFNILPHAEGPLLADIGQFEGTPYAEPAPDDETATPGENLFDCADVPDQIVAFSELFDRMFPAPGAPRVPELLAALGRASEAMRLTHEYAGAMFLPPLPGWDWYDSMLEIDQILARCAPRSR